MPRPPTRKTPNRVKGIERVVILGVTSRITIRLGMLLEAVFDSDDMTETLLFETIAMSLGVREMAIFILRIRSD